jgi:protein SCO1/2
MSKRTLILLTLLLAALLVLTGVAVRRGVLSPPRQTSLIGGPFQMVDQSGRTVDQGVLKGKWSAVFFGFTYCPEACPTTLLALGQTEALLGPRAREFQTVFISVDPARDTPVKLSQYLANSAFPRQVFGLTGTQAQVDQAAKAYHVYYQKAGSGADYTVNHSTITYLMNPKGRFACVLPYGATPQEMAQRIEAGMDHGSGAETC